MTAPTLKTTPLHAEHFRLGARMVDFGGWHMPVQYSGIMDEHHAVRKAAGLFDISHMGQFIAEGAGAASWLDSMLTNRVAKLGVGQGHYTFLLNAAGGVIDDLIVYRTGETEFLLIVNASKIEEDFAWLDAHRVEKASLWDRSKAFAGFALQGPQAEAILRQVYCDSFEPPARNAICGAGAGTLVARTGYTGEDGFEIFPRAEDAAMWWNRILEIGAPLGLKPCGLGSRDTLRMEMCYPLNGNDLSPVRTPLVAGLGMFVDLTKENFIGRDVLVAQKEQGLGERLAAIRTLEKGAPPRAHYGVWKDGAQIGELCSGTLSPSLELGIGLAYLPLAFATPGTAVEIDVRGRRLAAVVEKKPLYRK